MFAAGMADTVYSLKINALTSKYYADLTVIVGPPNSYYSFLRLSPQPQETSSRNARRELGGDRFQETEPKT
jgi:hypothetical protein